MSMKIPSHINCDHLLPNEDTLRIAMTVPSTRDRSRLMSHLVVASALLKTLDEERPSPAPRQAAVILPWAVLDAQGSYLGGHSSRDRARAACDRSVGQTVKNVRNPNGKG
jgi:hypothetical protein